MELNDWLTKISQVHPVAWDLGLERVSTVANRMGILSPAKKTVLVAGTNGKGSTCECLLRLAMRAGLRCGKATSPFLVNYNEQIVIDGVQVSDEKICQAFEAIESNRGETTLTYFEFSTLAALQIFNDSELDLAILEVGLGGRLDAMNIVNPDLSIITKIALDHEQWLGDTREIIAREKAGIMRPGKPCILVDSDPPSSLKTEAAQHKTPLLILDEDFLINGHAYERGDVAISLQHCGLPLPSAVAAIEACRLLDCELSRHDIADVLRRVSLPGRFQTIPGQVNTILDVGHNPNAAELLRDNCKQAIGRPVNAVVGMYADKDMAGVFIAMRDVVDNWFFADMPVDRAASAKDMAECLASSCGLTARTYGKVREAYDAAIANTSKGECVLVFGSFPVVADVLVYLETDLGTDLVTDNSRVVS